MFSTESRTAATSDNLTGAPLRYATISGAYSFALNNWSLARMSAVVRWSESWPLGVLAFCWLNIARTSSRLRPVLFSCVGLISTRTPGNAPPPMFTCPTPSI